MTTESHGGRFAFEGDADLDRESFTVDGQRLTEARAEALAKEIARQHGLTGGRPRKAADEKASVQKAVRFTPAQAERVADAARRRGESESELIRKAVDAYLESA